MNDRILKALRREPVDATPVWFMRQAGRTLPRYRESRAERDMLSILRDPPAAAEITATVTPERRLVAPAEKLSVLRLIETQLT